MGRSGIRSEFVIVDEVDWDSVDGDKVKEILEHHGVKGMHWGVRRTQSQLDSASDDFKTVAGHKTTIKTAGGTHALQNHELQTVVTRLNLEQQYSRLTAKPSALKEHQDTLKTVLGAAKTVQEVHSFVKGPLGKSILTVLKKRRTKS